MTLTNAQVWTIIPLAFLLLVFAIAAWESRGSIAARTLRDLAKGGHAAAPPRLTPEDAAYLKEAVRSRAGWSPGFVSHLVGEIDRVSIQRAEAVPSAGSKLGMQPGRMPS